MLRFIAMTILAYFIFRWLDRFFGGGSASRSGKASARGKFNSEQPSKSKVSNNVGEYVEYEEIKDDSQESDQ
ncbi:MAG: hypothetical protein OSA02_08410 [Schleiferiaceae bacterium]|nr:hypothetical protein [Schleiferiaceae bacterium]